ncbi:MAG: hypothetical protein ACPHWZ_10885, partial [Longimicrobiales bacterium]
MRGSGANALIRIPLHSFRLALAAVVVGGMTAQHAEAQTEAQRVVEVVDAYHAALVNGDSTAALSLLSEDVTILESGGVEDKEHYRSGHL